MGEPSPPRNRDRDMPPRTGDDVGTDEPLIPPPSPEPHERRPLPEQDTYERDREKEKKRPDSVDKSLTQIRVAWRTTMITSPS